MSDSQSNHHASIWDDDRITAYVMNELRREERDAFEQELARDPKLQSAVDQAHEVTAQLQQLYGDEPTVVLDAARRDAILTSNLGATVRHVNLNQSVGGKRLFAFVLAAAASLLLAIKLVPMMNDEQTAYLVPNDETVDESVVDESTAPADLQQPTGLSLEQPALGDRSGISMSAASPQPSSAPDAPIAPSSESFSMQPQEGQSGQPVLSKPPSVSPHESTQLSQSSRSFRAAKMMEGRNVQYDFGDDGQVRVADAGRTSSKSPADHDLYMMGGMDVPEGLSPANAEGDELMDGMGGSNADLDQFRLSNRNRFFETKPTNPSERASGLSSEKEVEYVPELGQVIVKGNTRDVHLVQEAIKNRLSRGWEADRSRAKAEANRLQDRLRLLGESPAEGDRFESIIENEFKSVSEHPLSTFSIDVDTASYSKVRQILNTGRLPRPDAVRAEELINYFDYQYEPPAADAEHPFAADVTITSCPWTPEHRLARVAIQGKRLQPEQRPACNLVFLLDTSGSMNASNKLPLVIDGMKMLTKQLGENDRVAIVVYAGSAGMVLESTSASKKKKIRRSLNKLSAGGSTNGEAGIQLAYSTARDNFIDGGVNRVILCTDGDFNVGTQNTGDLVRLIKEQASGGIFLTALGFGMGNHNDAMMERISGEGNGNYAFIDTANEAKKVLVRQTDATLITIAKDVKLQLEFNPRLVSAYRLIGYENRVLAKEDFNNDQKDAGEIGAGHQVTALYELVPAEGSAPPTEPDAETVQPEAESPAVDPLKYQTSRQLSGAASSNESMTIKLRYKRPDSDTSTKVEFKAIDEELDFAAADDDFQFAAAVASFAMQLRHSKFAGNWTLENVAETVAANQGGDEFGLRREFESLVSKAARLKVAE